MKGKTSLSEAEVSRASETCVLRAAPALCISYLRLKFCTAYFSAGFLLLFPNFPWIFNTMESDQDGKLNGKFPIFNDILAFMWCKISICPADTLISAIQGFYKHADIAKARDLLFLKVPDGTTRRVKHKKTDEILKRIYEVFQNIPTDNPPVFVAIDLNNLPCVNLSNIDGAALVCQQKHMKLDLAAIMAEQALMREKLIEISALVHRQRPSGQEVGPHRETTGIGLLNLQPSYANVAAPQGAPGGAGPRRVSIPKARSNGRRSAGADRGSQRSQTSVSVPQDMGESVAATDESSSIASTLPRQVQTEEHAAQEDLDGFTTQTSRRRRRNRTTITGSKTGTSLRSAPSTRKIKIFVTRLEANLAPTVLHDFIKELIDDECEVTKLTTKYPTYSSFVVTCDLRHKDKILNSEEWEEGILIKRFVGSVNNSRPDSGRREGSPARYSRND